MRKIDSMKIVIIVVTVAFLGIIFPCSNVSAALVVNTNMASIEAQKKLNATQAALSKVFERISSNFQINSAADDAAGLGVSQSLDREYLGVKQALRDTQDALSVIQTAESTAQEVANILKRMRELAIQSSSETLSSDESDSITTEFDQLKDDFERISTENENNSEIPSPLIQKAREKFYEQLQEMSDHFQNVDIGENDSSENLVLIQLIDANLKYLPSIQKEVIRISTTVIKNNEKRIKSTESALKKWEQQKKKPKKTAPKKK